MITYIELVQMYFSLQRLIFQLQTLERNILNSEQSTEQMLVDWALRIEKEAASSDHPILTRIIQSKNASFQLGMGWTQAAARAVVRKVLKQHPNFLLPPEFDLRQNESEAIRAFRRLEQELSEKTSEYHRYKEEYRRNILQKNGWGEAGSFRNPPPLIEGYIETYNIAAPRGRRAAPAELLLAIAHGLATGHHWWLMTPEVRKSQKWVYPAMSSMAQVQQAHKDSCNEDPQWAPNVTFISDDTIRWVPFLGRKIGSNYDRGVKIRVIPGASTGTIQWNSGKWSQREEVEASTFLASILCLLPHAKDDGTIAQIHEDQDQKSFRVAATVLAARKQDLPEYSWIVDPETEDEERICSHGMLHTKYDSELYRLGYQERRSFTRTGEEIRFARWRSMAERKEVVAKTAPLPFKVITRS
jgi:hypothetical protein